MDEATLTIGQVARQAGLKTSAIRYYEFVGLFPEPERESGQRLYGADAGAGGRSSTWRSAPASRSTTRRAPRRGHGPWRATSGARP